MQFQWYPGHMTKAKRQMQEDIKLIDLVIELVDARIPLGSRNPDIDELGKNKARLILMNKADLADDAVSREWAAFFKEKGCHVVMLDARSKADDAVSREWAAFFKEKGCHVVMLDARSKAAMKQVTAVVLEACREKIERDRKRGIKNRPVRAMVVGIPNVGKSTFINDRKRGIKNRPVRAMVVGIPNVGKSTFINSYAGRACAKTGNKPGVTKGKQWIRLNKNVELLDTPGILWPKFEDQTVGLHLALIGAIKDEILNIDELSLALIGELTRYYPGVLASRYGTAEQPLDEGAEPVDILRQIAENRKCISRGNELDYSKAAVLLLEEFRSGRLGKITIERP